MLLSSKYLVDLLAHQRNNGLRVGCEHVFIVEFDNVVHLIVFLLDLPLFRVLVFKKPLFGLVVNLVVREELRVTFTLYELGKIIVTETKLSVLGISPRVNQTARKNFT
jgi:hypothetical protein